MLESNTDSPKAWDELWNELQHQGDLCEASYAAVPHLVQVYLATETTDWNTYALVASIELARGKGSNRMLSCPQTIRRQHAFVRGEDSNL